MSNVKKIFATVTVVTMLGVAAVPAPASALTAAELQAQIDALMAQLNTLQGQLADVQGGTAPTTGGGAPAVCSSLGVSSFDRNLTVGSTGNDVKCLQAFLNQDAATKLADTGAGSPGSETSYFGPITRAAVIKFQDKYAATVLTPLGLSAGTGFFGPSSRSAVNPMLAAAAPAPAPAPTPTPEPTPTPTSEPTPAPTPAPTSGPVSVQLGPNNPAAKTVGASSAYNNVLEVQVNGGDAGASVTSVTVERFGLSVDTNVAGVLIVDENGNRHGNVVTLADNVAIIPFTADPITVPANGSATLQVQTHQAAGATAGTMGMKVTAMNGDPTGLPLSGSLHTLSATAGILGAVTVDQNNVSITNAVSVDIGQTDYVLAKFRIAESSSNEDIKLTRLTLFQNGTAADADLTNWDLVDPAGNVLATVAEATNKTVEFNLSGSPYTVKKGTNKDLTVRVDIASGSSRTGQVVVQNDFDVQVTGVSTGLGILPTAGPTVDTSFPVGDAGTNPNTLTIAQGTITINKSGTSPSGTFGIGQANVTLGTYEILAQGEDIQIQRADIEIEGTTVAADFSGTVKLMTDAGQTLYSVAASTAALYDGDASANDVVTFSTYYTIPAGTTLVLKLVADASTTVSNGDTAISGLGDVYFKRMTSNTFGTASGGTHVAGNTLQASAVTLTVTNNASLGNVTVIEGQSEVLIGSYLLQTSSSEGVNVSSINVDVVVAGEAALAALSNLKLKRSDTGAQLGTTVAAPAASNTFTVSGQLNIPASSTIQVDALVNMSTAASDGGTNDTYITNLDANDVSGTGLVSGTTIQGPSAVVTGRTITASQGGTLAASVETSGAAAAAHYTSGLTGVEMARVKLSSTVEDMAIERLVLTSINGAGNIANVKLLGTGLASDPSVPLTAGDAVFTFASGSEITIPSYGSRVLTAVVDISGVGTTVAGNFGVLGWGTANARGAASGIVVQESLTGTSYTAGTDAYSGDLGDVVYWTVTADAGTTTAPGFAMVTTDDDTVNLATGDLDLEGEATDTSWAAGDIVTKLTKVESIAGNANAGTAYDIGEIVYVYDSDDNEAGFAIVTTAVASGNAISGLAFSPAGNVSIAAAADRVTLFTNANSLYGNTMRYEEVEPVITKNASSPSGSGSSGALETVAVFDVKASGSRDMTFNSLTLEKSGNNSPDINVVDLSLWNGATQLARVASTTVAGSTAAGVTNADTILNLCSGTSDTAGEVGDITQAEADTLKVGDRLSIIDGTNTNAVTINAITGTTIAACNSGAPATGYAITFSGTTTIAASATVTFRNNRVHFDASQANTNDVALAEQTITSDQTMTLTVKADTNSVRSGLGAGVSGTFAVNVPGTGGPLQTATTQVEGLNWDYTPLGTGAAVYRTEADGYPVNGNTLTY